MPQIKHVGEIHGASFHLSLNSGLTRQSVCLETVHVHVLEPCCYSNSYKSLSAMFIYHGWQMLMYSVGRRGSCKASTCNYQHMIHVATFSWMVQQQLLVATQPSFLLTMNMLDNQ